MIILPLQSNPVGGGPNRHISNKIVELTQKQAGYGSNIDILTELLLAQMLKSRGYRISATFNQARSVEVQITILSNKIVELTQKLSGQDADIDILNGVIASTNAEIERLQARWDSWTDGCDSCIIGKCYSSDHEAAPLASKISDDLL